MRSGQRHQEVQNDPHIHKQMPATCNGRKRARHEARRISCKTAVYRLFTARSSASCAPCVETMDGYASPCPLFVPGEKADMPEIGEFGVVVA